jgi:hypothetical protein
VEAIPRRLRRRQLATVAAAVVVAGLLIGAYLASSSSAPPPGPVSPAASYPFPPVWSSTVPGDTAFGGVLEGNSYYTIVPRNSSVLPTLNALEFEVVALDLQTGAVQWASAVISIHNESNVQPSLVASASDVYVVGYSAPLIVPGEPGNGTSGVFAIGLNSTSGAANSFANSDKYPTSWVQEAVPEDGSVYYGALVDGSVALSAFPLPGPAAGAGVTWSSSFPLPAGFSSNLAFRVDGGFVLVLLPASVAIVSATTGAFLENLVVPDSLNLFDGTVLDGVAYGVQWLGTGFFLQGYGLSDGALVLNESMPRVSVPGEPFFIDPVGNDLLVTLDSGASWSDYSSVGLLQWTVAVGATSIGAPPVPIGSDQVLLGSGPPPNLGAASGNLMFHESYLLVSLATGAVVWQTDPLFEVSAGEMLFLAPNGGEEPPTPTIEAHAGNDVVMWWGGATALATL